MGTIRLLHSCRACVTFADEMKFDVKNTRPAVDRLHMAIRCWGLQSFLWLAWARCLHSLRFQNRAWACLSFRIQMGREGVYEHHGAPRGTLGVERAEPHLNQKHTPFSKKFKLRLAELPVAGLGLLLELLALSKLCLCMLELPYANGAGGRI